jgi:activator of HSP90 ATPase
MPESLHLETILHATPEQIYAAWLDSREHGLFTGSAAEIDPQVGGSFTAWEGYIQGQTLEVEPFHRIRQSWRTTEFPEDCGDSDLELLFDSVSEGTRLTLVHTNIPDGQGESYRQGWEDYYFTPMQAYFTEPD